MENHPIPQDITGFQFKLIGSMTVKQFAYLAAGFFFAWLFYISPLFIIIKIPLAVCVAALGASFAFLPIEGRPMDLMLKNFFLAVFKPTQYTYETAGTGLVEKEIKSIKEFNKKRMEISDMSDKQLQDFLSSLPKATKKLDEKEMVFFQNVQQYQTTPLPQKSPEFVPQHAYATVAPQTLMPELQNQAVSPSLTPPKSNPQPQIKPAANIQLPNIVFGGSLPQTPTAPIPTKIPVDIQQPANPQEYLDAHQKVLELQKNQNDLMFEKQKLEERLIQLQKQMELQNQTVYSPSVAKPEPQQTQFVRSVPKDMAKSVGLPTTPEFPNVISGIVKDPRGNPLGNILVEIKDAQGSAVRAFKTNALGQFASATPLANGDFTAEFDDPRGQNKFDTVGFKAIGEVILPIEVISVDTREELRRSLFN